MIPSTVPFEVAFPLLTATPSADRVRLDASQALVLRAAMREIHASLEHALDARLRHRGVSAAQCRLLDAFRRRPQATLAEAALELDMDAASASRLLARLEGLGLCLRFRPRGDRRNVRVELLPAGAALADDFPALQADVAELALAGFDPRERRLLSDGLRRLLNGAAPSPATMSAAIAGETV